MYADNIVVNNGAAPGLHTPDSTGNGKPASGGEKNPTRRAVMVMLAVSVITGGVLAIFGILAGEFSQGLRNALLSVAAMGGFSGLALYGTRNIDQREDEWLPKASVAAAVFGLVTALIYIWGDQSETAAKLPTVGFIVAFAACHASALAAGRRLTDSWLVQRLVTVTQCFIALATVLLCIAVVASEQVGEGFGRLVAVVLVIDVMLNVLVPILRRMLPSGPEAGQLTASGDGAPV